MKDLSFQIKSSSEIPSLPKELIQILNFLKEIENFPPDSQTLYCFYQIKKDLSSVLRNLDFLAEYNNITWEVCGWNHSSILNYLYELDKLQYPRESRERI